jgi:hypothetical protein
MIHSKVFRDTFNNIGNIGTEYVTNDKRALVGNLTIGIWITVGGLYQPWLIKTVGDWKVFHHLIFMQGLLVLVAPW